MADKIKIDNPEKPNEEKKAFLKKKKEEKKEEVKKPSIKKKPSKKLDYSDEEKAEILKYLRENKDKSFEDISSYMKDKYSKVKLSPLTIKDKNGKNTYKIGCVSFNNQVFRNI